MINLVDLQKRFDTVFGDPNFEKDLLAFIKKRSADQKPESNEHNPYCPDCDSCGEDPCCPAANCKMTPTGHYCESNLKTLRLAYWNHRDLLKLIDAGGDKYKELLYIYDMIDDKNHNIIYGTK